MTFHIIASTGRTATTYLSSLLNSVDGVLALHEGYPGGEHSGDPLLPLINLENNLAYQRPQAAAQVIAEKRGSQITDALARTARCGDVVDIAYYYPPLAQALLASNSESRMVGIVREAESFVRSATHLEGEDPLPVGWPEPTKGLTDREKFIAMGRMRPRRGTPEHADWPQWSATRRNIWLWLETNRLLLDACLAFPARVTILKFEDLREDAEAFAFAISRALLVPECPSIDNPALRRFHNTKPSGYQLGPKSTWSANDRDALVEAEKLIDNLMEAR